MPIVFNKVMTSIKQKPFINSLALQILPALVLMLYLSGCNSVETPQSPTIQIRPTYTNVPTLLIPSSNSDTPTPEKMKIPTMTATTTLRPTITLTPTLSSFFLPYSDLYPITLDNLGKIQKIAEWYQSPTMSGLVFSPDGSILAAANLQPNELFPIKLWSTKNGQLLSSLAINGQANLRLASSPDGKLLAAVFYSQGAFLWDMQTGNALPSPSGNEATISLAFSPNSKTLAYGTAFTAQLSIWDLTENHLLRPIKAERHDIQTISFSPDGNEIMTGGGITGVEVWNSSNGQLINQLRVAGGCTVLDSAVSDTGYVAFLGQYCPGHAYVIEIRNISNWQIVLDKGDLIPLAFAFLPSTNILVISTCSDYQNYPEQKCVNNEILFLNIETGTILSKIPDVGEILGVSKDGKRIAFVTWEGRIQIWGIPKQ